MTSNARGWGEEEDGVTVPAAMLLYGGVVADNARQAGSERCYDTGGSGQQRQATRAGVRRRGSGVAQNWCCDHNVFFSLLCIVT